MPLKDPLKNPIAHIAIATLVLFLIMPAAMALDSGIEIDGIDTVAGYGALIRIHNAPAQADLEILIEKPDGSQILLEAESDDQGKAKVDLEGFYTKRAGTYTLQAREVGPRETLGPTAHFTVYPDTVSASRSTVSVDQTMASANGNDYVALEVHLKDRYSNPIEGHTVTVISSRLNDEIVRISKNPYTDARGSMLFHLYSREAGVSTFVLHDSTSNVTLNDRAKIAFYKPNQTSNAIGGHTSILLATSTSSGPISNLAIEDLESTLEVGETENFTVTAYDDGGNVASDYTGTVRFSSSDDNATLPDDYEFEAEDQGMHTFSLSLSFKTTGSQTLTVTDTEDTDIYGEIEVEVTSSGTGNSSTSSSSSSSSDDGSTQGFNVVSPSSGTYSSSSLSFSGNATYGQTIQIDDQGSTVGTTSVKADGSFSYTLTGLQDGEHLFTVSAVSEGGTIEENSNEIAITIDTTGPEIDQIEIAPEGGIPAESTFTITIYTEKNLPEVSVLFNNELFDLIEDVLVDGVYQTTLTAPEELGEYELDVILVDEVGNEASINAAATIEVVEATDDLYASAAEEETVPCPVSGTEAVVGDGRVTLSWESPSQWTQKSDEEDTEDAEMIDEESEETIDDCEDEEEEEEITASDESGGSDESELSIDHYRIYYGPDAELLYSSEDTWDNSTTWYVDELENGTAYYFKIVAVTTEDLEGEVDEKDIVSATPESAEEEVLYQAALEDEEENLEEEAEEEAIETAVEEGETPETGPEIFWLITFSMGFGILYFHRQQRLDTINLSSQTSSQSTPRPDP